MSKTLTKGELIDLLGTPQVDRQRDILKNHGITPIDRPDGSLGVTWEVINARMLGAEVAGMEQTTRRTLNMNRPNPH